VTNNNGFQIGRLDLLAILIQLQPIITVHNQWLSKTRSIPLLDHEHLLFYWDEWRRKNHCSHTELPYECRIKNLSWTELTSRRTEYKSACLTVPLFFSVSSVATKRVSISWKRLISPSVFVIAKTCFSDRCLAIDYSVFQGLCHTRCNGYVF
jgi:hypothetical protein